MLKNYIKIAFRNLWKTKGYSLLNIIGLSIGMAAAMLIFLWIENEMSMDRFHEKGDRTYIMYNRDIFQNGDAWAWNTTPKPLGPTLKENFSDVEDFTRYYVNSFLVKNGDKKLKGVAGIVDSSFLNIFSFPLLKGNARIALNSTYNIVLTENFAKAVFGNDDPMGKPITIDSSHIFSVTGVLKDLPKNTELSFDYLLPIQYENVIAPGEDSWYQNYLKTYVVLRDKKLHESFNEKIKNVKKEHTNNENTQSSVEIFAHPLEKQYLYGKNENGKLVAGNMVTVRLFMLIGSFILLIACINFMNLSTARSEKRAKEVGIRKVVGVTKGVLIAQFLIESVVICLISFAIAIFIVNLVLPSFNLLVGKSLSIPFNETLFWIYAASFIIITGIIAGSYPSFFLSSFNPVKVLKGTYRNINTALSPRKVLVCIQFTFSTILIISTIIISKQIKYGLDRDAGYDKNNLVYVFNQGDIEKHYLAIKNELINRDAILSSTKNRNPITQRWSDSWGFKWENSTKDDEKKLFIRMGSDAEFASTMGIEIMEGRDIDIYKYPSDSSAVVLNESAIKTMKLKDPIGKKMGFASGDLDMTIVGVMKDFVLESPFQNNITPLILGGPKLYDTKVIHFKLNPLKGQQESVNILKEVISKYNPEYPPNYVFVDENYATKFISVERTSKLVVLFAGLTIFISCLGLFGLATYMAENRVKEIGIRKVLGASTLGITGLLSIDFLKLVFISFLIASPIAWYVMNEWLDDYSYKINIEWWIFLLTLLVTIIITLITVSFQSIKAAIANPVKSIRNE